jgi:DNA helicase-2/ATP-dependent DNA helicase PcrA
MRAKGVQPTEILCTTFTKKATQEMTERLEKLVPASYVRLMTLGTTHSIAYHILKREYKALNHHMANAFNNDMLMNNAQKRFMEDIKKDIMKDMSVPFEIKQELNEIAVPQFMKAFGLAKNDNIGHREYEAEHGDSPSNRMQAYVLFYNRYEERKWENRVLDGDDLLFLLVRLFQEHEDILQKYQGKYKYLLVDEAQDNNNLQYMLIKMLAHPHYNAFIVGDDDQSMYSFRGARPEEFIYFKDKFKNTQMIALEYNYRSVPGILKAANMLIANNQERIVKQLRTHKAEEDKAVMYSAYKDENDEAKAVVDEIKNLTEESKRFEHKQVAVLYRTNAQSRAFEDQLIMSGLPYVIHGGISFYERAEVKDIVAYLKLVLDPDNNEAFERIYNKPKRYLGKAFLEKARRQADSYWKAINNPMFQKTLRYEKKGVNEIIDLLTNLRGTGAAGGTPEELVDIILQQGGYEDFLKEDGDEEEEGNSRMENITTLKYVMQKFDNLDSFLDYITMMTTTAKHDINGVQLMTIHKSKGLEFDAGFVVGMSEGILPHFKAVEDSEDGTRPKAIEEERRLAYVAVTRARTVCYTSSIRSFNGRHSNTSRFIKEMESELVPVNVEIKDVNDLPNYSEQYGLEGTVQGRMYRGSEGIELERRRIGEEFNKAMAKEIREVNKLIREAIEED